MIFQIYEAGEISEGEFADGYEEITLKDFNGEIEAVVKIPFQLERVERIYYHKTAIGTFCFHPTRKIHVFKAKETKAQMS